LQPPSSEEWTRKHDDQSEPPFIPEGVGLRVYPESLEDLVTVVTRPPASETRGIRACGSHWALSAAVADPGYSGCIVETHRLNRTLYNVIPVCLTDAVRRDLLSQSPQTSPGDAVYNLYHVESGVRIHDLYSRLDRQDEHWQAMPTDSLGARVLMGSWAMPTLGNSGGQTIVGAAATSTHGGDHSLPPLADAIEAIHMVATGGKQFWLERAEFSERVRVPMCDSDALRREFPSIEVVQDDDVLNAAIVGIGRLGVIYSVVLRVEPQYGLREVRWRGDWTGIAKLLRTRDPVLFGQRFLQVVVNPVPRHQSSLARRVVGSQHSCWITQREAIRVLSPLPPSWIGRTLRAGKGAGKNPPIDERPHDLYGLVCHSRINFAPVFQDALEVVRGLDWWMRIVPGLGSARRKRWDLLVDELSRLAAQTTDSLGDFIANVCNFLVAEGHGNLVSIIAESLLSFGQQPTDPAHPLEDVSYALLDRNDYLDRDCITDVDSIEIALNADTEAPVKLISTLCERTRQLIEGSLTGTPLAFAGFASMRFTGSTRALLGMQQWRHTCNIEIGGPKRLSGLSALLDQIEKDAKQIGGTIHWGQRNHLTRDEVEKMYSGLGKWREALRRLTAGGDALLFSTMYSRQAGLEALWPKGPTGRSQ
jgi:hypothetical protein